MLDLWKLYSVFKDQPTKPWEIQRKIFVFIYLCVPRWCWLHNGKNRTSIAVCLLKLFDLQSLAFYFEMDSILFKFDYWVNYTKNLSIVPFHYQLAWNFKLMKINLNLHRNIFVHIPFNIRYFAFQLNWI